MKSLLLKSSAVALLLSGVAFSGSAFAQETIKIAFAGPVTGPVSQYGTMVKDGVLTAIEQINAAGGVNGKKLELVTEDDACEPKQAVLVANRIVSSGIKFVVGHVCSGATIAAADIYDREGIVMVTPSATSPLLTDAVARSSIFRTIGRDDQQAPAAVEYIVNKVKPKKVAVLHDKQSYGQGIATAVKAGLEAQKVPVVLFEGINAGESDYSVIVTKMKSEGVDFIYFGGYHPELGLIARQSRERGLTAGIMSDEGAANEDLQRIAGAAAEGILMTLPPDLTKEPANAEIVKAFQAQKRNPDGPFQMSAYTAVLALAEGMKVSKGEDSDAVAKAMHEIKFSSPLGQVSFDKKGDLSNFKFVISRQNKDGTRSAAE